MRGLTLLTIMLLCLPGTVRATAIESAASIRAAVLDIVGSDAEITLDPAVRMPRCGAVLQARRNGTGTVEVSCPAPPGWRLFVPVRIRRQQPVLILARAIAAGETLRADMLTRDTRDITRIVGVPLSNPAEAIGQTARRTLAAGSVLTAAHLRTPHIVHRGDQITLISHQGGIEVRMAARALGTAGIGERISAENLSSRKRVQGVVMDNGEVRVHY